MYIYISLSYHILYHYYTLVTLYLLGWKFSILIFFAFSQSYSLASYCILLSTQKLSRTVKNPIEELIDGNWRSIKQKSMDLIWTRPWRFGRHAYMHTHEKYVAVKHTVNTIRLQLPSTMLALLVDAPNLTFGHFAQSSSRE